MRRIVVVVLVLTTVFIACRAWAQDSTPDVQRRVVLNVHEKDPRHAYWMTLWPVVGPIMGAEYAGSSPLSATIPSALSSRAWVFAAIDFAEIVGLAGAGYGIGLAAEPENVSYHTNDEGVRIKRTEPANQNRWIGLGAGFALGMIASVVTNIFPAGANADYCVEYNRKLHEEFRWRAPELGFDGDAYSVTLGFSF